MGKKPMKPPMAKKAAAPSPASPAARATAERQGREAASDNRAPRSPVADQETSSAAGSSLATKRRDPSKGVAPQAASVAEAERDITVSLQSPLEVKQMVCEVRMPPSLFKRLRILPMEVVTLAAGGMEYHLEAVVGGATAGSAVSLHPLLLDELRERRGKLSVASREVVGGKAILGAPAAAVVEVEPDDEDARGIQGASVAGMLAATFAGRVLCEGMPIPLMFGSITHHFVVTRIESNTKEAMPFAKLTGTTKISLGGVQAESSSDAPEDTRGRIAAVQLLPKQTIEISGWMEGTRGGPQMLLVGGKGAGKTYALRQIEDSVVAAEGSVTWLKPGDVVNTGEDSPAMHMDKIFARAAVSPPGRPAVLLIDGLEYVLGRDNEGGAASLLSAWGKRQISAALASAMDAFPTLRVAAAVTDVKQVPPTLLTAGRFGTVIEIDTPSCAADREQILRTMRITRSVFADITEAGIAAVAANAHGYTPQDLRSVLDQAIVGAYERDKATSPSDTDLLAAAKRVRPTAIKSFDITIPNVKWTDIGGSERAKKALQECVEWCLGKDASLFRKFDLRPPKGVLLYGPPGCSKTMLAKALAHESGLNFVSVKGPEVFSKWVGDSEKAVRAIFQRARMAAPCVVFVDELDGMCAHRGGGGVADRVISQFLTELDGLPAAMSKSSDSIVFVAATNRPDNIDRAVLRPGRIDRKVYVGLPDPKERLQIAKITLRGIPVDPDVTAELVANHTGGYSGAEVVAVVKEAAFDAVRQSTQAETVTMTNLEAAFQRVKPRLSAKDVEWYHTWDTK